MTMMANITGSPVTAS